MICIDYNLNGLLMKNENVPSSNPNSIGSTCKRYGNKKKRKREPSLNRNEHEIGLLK